MNVLCKTRKINFIFISFSLFVRFISNKTKKGEPIVTPSKSKFANHSSDCVINVRIHCNAFKWSLFLFFVNSVFGVHKDTPSCLVSLETSSATEKRKKNQLTIRNGFLFDYSGRSKAVNRWANTSQRRKANELGFVCSIHFVVQFTTRKWLFDKTDFVFFLFFLLRVQWWAPVNRTTIRPVAEMASTCATYVFPTRIDRRTC